MKVKELRKLLDQIENEDAEVVVSISQANQAYPVAYVPINQPMYDKLQQINNDVRIQVSLPNNDTEYMYTGKRKL